MPHSSVPRRSPHLHKPKQKWSSFTKFCNTSKISSLKTGPFCPRPLMHSWLDIHIDCNEIERNANDNIKKSITSYSLRPSDSQGSIRRSMYRVRRRDGPKKKRKIYNPFTRSQWPRITRFRSSDVTHAFLRQDPRAFNSLASSNSLSSSSPIFFFFFHLGIFLSAYRSPDLLTSSAIVVSRASRREFSYHSRDRRLE